MDREKMHEKVQSIQDSDDNFRYAPEERRKKEKKRVNEEMAHLANRALLLLSFKDTTTQNLRYVFKVLGIQTLDDKRKILQEIYRLIREGIVYVSRGFSKFIDQRSRFDVDNFIETKDIDLYLLRPYNQIIKEIQDDIAEMKENKERI